MSLHVHTQDWLSINDGIGMDIFRAVKKGMLPFRYKRVDLYYEFDIDYNRYRLVADVILLDNSRLAHFELSDAEEMAINPEQESYRISKLMFEAFRNRDDWPIPHKIVLGEY